MAQIKIKNVGPIKEAEFLLNKINVFMGPQSSGKSTIAKIISYCQWVEKRVLLDGEYKEKAEKQLLKYHHLHENYFEKNSFFEYESDFIKIRYGGKNLNESIEVEKSKILDYKKTKNIYIPAERNFVSVIPNLGKYNETNDNIMNLIYDWYDAKKEIGKQEPKPILNLGVDYYYQKNAENEDMLVLKNKKEIPLNTGSSGLQSIIPLVLILDYLTEKFYEIEIPLRQSEKDYLQELFGKDYSEFDSRRKNYHSTNFIIEEPEQNLFPETQRDLIYYLLKKCSGKRDHSLTITTHSPYVLYALNNCMLGDLVNSQIKGTEREKEFLDCSFLSKESWINSKSVSVWEIEDGKLRQVQDEDNIISKNYFDNIMTDLTDEYFEMLEFYDDEE